MFNPQHPLYNIAKEVNMPAIFFEGPSNVGKTTLIHKLKEVMDDYNQKFFKPEDHVPPIMIHSPNSDDDLKLLEPYYKHNCKVQELSNLKAQLRELYKEHQPFSLEDCDLRNLEQNELIEYSRRLDLIKTIMDNKLAQYKLVSQLYRDIGGQHPILVDRTIISTLVYSFSNYCREFRVNYNNPVSFVLSKEILGLFEKIRVMEDESYRCVRSMLVVVSSGAPFPNEEFKDEQDKKFDEYSKKFFVEQEELYLDIVKNRSMKFNPMRRNHFLRNRPNALHDAVNELIPMINDAFGTHFDFTLPKVKETQTWNM